MKMREMLCPSLISLNRALITTKGEMPCPSSGRQWSLCCQTQTAGRMVLNPRRRNGRNEVPSTNILLRRPYIYLYEQLGIISASPSFVQESFDHLAPKIHLTNIFFLDSRLDLQITPHKHCKAALRQEAVRH
jgi:hypothetical protein